MPHIASTLSADVHYTIYEKKNHPSGANTVVHKIKVKGGANVANSKHILADRVLTPKGVVTKVSEEDLALLEKDEVFQTHKKNGFVQIIHSNAAPDADKAARDLEAKDQSAPFAPDDYKEGGRAQKMAVPGADDLEAPVVKAAEAPKASRKGR